MDVPAELNQAIERELEGVPLSALRESVERLSERYRMHRGASASRFIADHDDIAAYVGYRMPATFAAVASAMSEVARIMGAWTPRSVLDVGAGPGAAAWAAVEVWPEIERCVLVDRDPRMISTGRRMTSDHPHRALARAEWIAGTQESLPQSASFDLVVCAYTLNEIAVTHRQGFVDDLWRRTQGVLLLVDAGTPDGFRGIVGARRELLAAGAHMVAPCPHSDACPLEDSDWCHFSARVGRSRLHRALKQGERSFEDEKFSYVAVARQPVFVADARIIRHPLTRKGYVQLRLCTPGGVIDATVSRRQGAIYRAARDARWGDGWEP